ncbi:glycerol-3-phosphate acyltransferase [Actinomarinicola tropica]|uniref:Glycerol-3-phosphate acyltransferase n=1 Tax=Actinomarinicola tropica TaxID=2789776 RepID=A0A5Q2RPQ1_9ACTN|nr:glycerol-3-phosphate acyltransferase [Actinomarinicola tropica]QGG96097.1 acyl-phosphate glycerol 3-phosphate acyltransferase [Actinomarinicola tropica]
MFGAPGIVMVGAVLASYALGTLPTAVLVGTRRGVDPTTAGSGNPGASNVYRLMGRRAGVAVLVVDLLKGLLPALAALVLIGRPLALACGLAAVVGHVAPIQRRFRGGKGVATAGGVALVLWPLVSVVLVAAFLLAGRLVGIASVGSLVMAVGLPVGVGLTGRPLGEVLAAAALALLVVLRHAGNIRRLLRGEEQRTRRPDPAPRTLE